MKNRHTIFLYSCFELGMSVVPDASRPLSLAGPSHREEVIISWTIQKWRRYETSVLCYYVPPPTSSILRIGIISMCFLIFGSALSLILFLLFSISFISALISFDLFFSVSPVFKFFPSTPHYIIFSFTYFLVPPLGPENSVFSSCLIRVWPHEDWDL